jgi:hypothetical protein
LRASRRAAWVALKTLAAGVMVFAAASIPLPTMPEPHVAGAEVLVSGDRVGVGFDKVVDLPLRSALVGLTWSGLEPAGLEVRPQHADRSWGEWLPLDGNAGEGPDASTGEPSNHVSAGPAWIGRDIRRIEVRVTEGTLPDLTVHAIDSDPVTLRGASLSGVASGDTPQPRIIPRAAWGADESLRLANCPSGPDYGPPVRAAVVHHTVNSNDYGPSDSAALVRGIYYFHTQSNGWCDVGYNFIVDRFGQIFEGRFGGIAASVIGAHAGGFNAGSTGVSYLGNSNTTDISPQAYNSIRSVLAWKLALTGVNPLGSATFTVQSSTCECQNWPPGTVVTIPAVTGHRDLNATGCPGAALYDLLNQLRVDLYNDISSQGPGAFTCQWVDDSGDGPSAATAYQNRLDVFDRDPNGSLRQKVWIGGAWLLTQPLGGYLTWGPSSAAKNGRYWVTARGGDGAVYYRYWNGLVWSPWTSIGGYVGSAPTVTTNDGITADVFACGRNSGLFVNRFNGAVWLGWQALGQVLTSAPAATSLGGTDVAVVFRGIDGALWRMTRKNGAWTGPDSAGGALTSGPGVVHSGNGRLDVVARGTDGALYANVWTTAGGWYGWYRLGGYLTSDPDIATRAPGMVDVVARGGDGANWIISWTGTTWTSWSRIP